MKSKNKDSVKNKKSYTSPQSKLWGKILIGFLAISFVVAIVATVIFFIVNSILNV